MSFKELETAGWSEAGRADAYDRVVGRVNERAIEPLLHAASIRPPTRGSIVAACGVSRSPTCRAS